MPDVDLRKLTLLAVVGLASGRVPAQTTLTQSYTLLSGSALTDDCPICDRVPITVPLIGTFSLQPLDQTPLVTRYLLTNILFRTGATSGLPYQVIGDGIYEIGGEVALTQELFLNAQISNGFTSVNAQCINTNGAVTQPWPRIQIQLEQTNGTPAQVYYLSLVTAPMPKIRSIVPEPQSSSIQLSWEDLGGAVQLERAKDIAGPYVALTSTATNSSFTDPGVLTNFARLFYRVRPL